MEAPAANRKRSASFPWEAPGGAAAPSRAEPSRSRAAAAGGAAGAVRVLQPLRAAPRADETRPKVAGLGGKCCPATGRRASTRFPCMRPVFTHLVSWWTTWLCVTSTRRACDRADPGHLCRFCRTLEGHGWTPGPDCALLGLQGEETSNHTLKLSSLIVCLQSKSKGFVQINIYFLFVCLFVEPLKHKQGDKNDHY